MTTHMTKELIDRIFKEPGIKYELTEFENPGKPIDEVLSILSFCLNSPAGQLQVEMHQRGTSGQLELYPFDIRKFLVWSAPESLQEKIRNLYDQSAANEQQSKELLNQAKSRVEQLIEEAAR